MRVVYDWNAGISYSPVTRNADRAERLREQLQPVRPVKMPRRFDLMEDIILPAFLFALPFICIGIVEALPW